jgi:uncharacterized protein YbjT (DUF2867 family)
MRIAITGGDGFVGGHVARELAARGHDPVVLSRRTGVDLAAPDLADLRRRLDGVDAVVLCAGVNLERGRQTYARIHVAGTRFVVEAARDAGVQRVVLVSFLRARPDGPSAYHRSKWLAERIVRESGLAYTIVKPGVIFGSGDHLLDHLSRAFRTFPVFGLVGRDPRAVRPVAVADVAHILAAAALGDPGLDRRTVAVLGPETVTLEAAVRRVAAVVGRRPWFIPLPIAAHRLLARVAELVMVVPLVSRAQVEILAEGVTEPAADVDALPDDLRPRTPFDAASIAAGLPPPVGFRRTDLRWCVR